MDYPLENLDPEKFQKFCQALLVKEFPQMQCFPVAQPDGGRDAASFFFDSGNDKFLVFQVKYVRKPQAEADPHKWLVAIMEEEAPKVRDLIPKGATGYFLLTNIPGTAHLDRGSIDTLNTLLTRKLEVPSQCWWRDDINRRLDNAWNLKWAYPELMAGPDFLRLILESGLAEHKERRASAIRAFLRAQYDMDEEVKFKQVELQNKLLDLFVDVPASLRDQTDQKLQHKFYGVATSALTGDDPRGPNPGNESHALYFDQAPRWHSPFDVQAGTATLVLSNAMQQRMPHAVIEGAPGQGKSTLAQYICQVHRMRLLGETEALNSISKQHAAAPTRLPIKVDLRDFAVWLGKKDPFNVEQEDATPNAWNKSLESFLAALISHQSGGTTFSTDDLLALFRISSVLLVLDGLDEVADMSRRHEVVNEVTKGVTRLEENAASLQSIVTSRPAAFANSPGMPQAKFPHLQLLSLSRQLILNYADRWLKARHMESKQSVGFRKILREKLDQPHLRDLARNPMQLAILLSLILTRGASLPDKRTALYDFYIDLFFNREAEKSHVVRDYRDLLIDIHRFLAWHLHSQAERNNARPSIRQDVLQQTVADYLLREGHDPALSKELFTGMVERVVALVSRVEGTFEFEVQPLREYFAACHLYYTAPQSSPGKETSGSKPDRFDAIARNFYWLNVARFYAGCYSKGELPSLVERLQELAASPGFRLISHPRMLAATLLGDWVFTQNPRSVQQVVETIFKPESFRYVLAPQENRRLRSDAQNALVLPPKCGREELIRRCFEMLAGSQPTDVASQILDLIKANSEANPDVGKLWIQYALTAEEKQRLKWLDYGDRIGVLGGIPLGELGALLATLGLSEDSTALSLLFRARKMDYLHSSEVIFEKTVQIILDRHFYPPLEENIESPLDALSNALDSFRYSVCFRDRQPVPLAVLLQSRYRNARLTWSPQISTETESFASHRLCVDLAKTAELELQKSTLVWSSDIAPWNAIIEHARALWGEQWSLLCLANTAAGIRSTTEKCADSADIFDDGKPLARRYRFARLKSGAYKWWDSQLREAISTKREMFALLPMLTWATNSAVLMNALLLDQMLEGLSLAEWRRLAQAVKRTIFHTRQEDERKEQLERAKLPSRMGLRLASILYSRTKPEDARHIYERYMMGLPSEDYAILQYFAREALDLRHVGTESWSPNLDLLETCYAHEATFDPTNLRAAQAQSEMSRMSLTLAATILESSDKYPLSLLSIAEDRFRQDVASKIMPVATVAENDDWFRV